MPNTYTAISTTTVGSGGTSSIVFSSIPQTYTDLLLKISLRRTISGVSDIGTRINSITDFYYYRQIVGNGSTVSSNVGSNMPYCYIENGVPGNDYTTFSNTEVYIPNYTSSLNKQFLSQSVSENNSSTAYSFFSSGYRSTTSPISSLTIISGVGTISQYSTATLYGILKA